MWQSHFRFSIYHFQMPDFPARQVIAYTVVALFVVFFFSNGLSNHIETARLLSGNGRQS